METLQGTKQRRPLRVPNPTKETLEGAKQKRPFNVPNKTETLEGTGTHCLVAEFSLELRGEEEAAASPQLLGLT
jgi:hypothetical protein